MYDFGKEHLKRIVAKESNAYLNRLESARVDLSDARNAKELSLALYDLRAELRAGEDICDECGANDQSIRVGKAITSVNSVIEKLNKITGYYEEWGDEDNEEESEIRELIASIDMKKYENAISDIYDCFTHELEYGQLPITWYTYIEREDD